MNIKKDYTDNSSKFLTSIENNNLRQLTSISKSNSLSDYQLNTSEFDIIRTPYQLEQQLLEAVKNADTDEIDRVSSQISKYSIGKVSDNYDKSVEYYAVIAITLYSRTAITAGIDPYIAYNISDIYLQALSRCQTNDDRIQICLEASKTYISEIKKMNARKKNSPYIEKTKSYIARNLTKNYSMQDLAEIVGIDKAYLMRLFKKYENCTITQYIHQQKISAAQNMLKYSDYSINQIATYLQFASQSHFASVFKKITGQNPQEYRISNKRFS